MPVRGNPLQGADHPIESVSFSMKNGKLVRDEPPRKHPARCAACLGMTLGGGATCQRCKGSGLEPTP